MFVFLVNVRINKRPVPDQGSVVCFAGSPGFIVYKHDSYVGCTLRKWKLSYMSLYLIVLNLYPLMSSIDLA